MESTLRSFINRVDFVKNSEMGHPIYRVTFTPSKGKTMIGYTRSKSHLSQICPSFEGDTCDVAYDINDKGKVIVRDIKKCGGEMNESKLKKIINESFKRSGGFISHDGNGMVGGRWESWTVEGVWTPLSYLDEKINEKIHDPELTQDISEFIEGFYNDDEYGIVAIINGCYDESVGIRPDAPEYRIEEVTTDNFDTWIKEIDSSKFSFEIKTILKNIIKQMFDDAYDVDIDEYEIDYSDYDYDDYLNESKLKKIINESVRKTLNELDWKTYANAAKARLKQNRENPNNKETWDKYYDLEQMANQKFDDDYVGLLKYDTHEDKSKKKKSPKFSSSFKLSKTDRMPYGAVKGTNKSGDGMFSTGKGRYFSTSAGYIKPGSFFRDKEVADSFEKANDELWNYDEGNYEYKKGEGWQLKESKLRRIVGESMNRVLKENANVPDFYDFIDILERNGWSYSDYQNVQTKDGRSAKRYIVYKDDKNSSDFKTLQQGLKNTFGDNVDFGIAQYRYAPEIKHYTVIILDYNDDDASAPLNESKLRRIIKGSIDKYV